MAIAMERGEVAAAAAPAAADILAMPSDLSFKSLKPLELREEDFLPSTPVGVVYGTLDNGMCYYVRQNAKPRARAALALGVRIGSVMEEEEERGVAHILEHLAFSATTKYTNHDIVKFLESIGAEFGACQNAMTSADETIYELLVPVDKPELLSQAISVLAEFSAGIRASQEDLEKERGAVMEEYRGDRNALGRMQEAHWLLLMQGSKYADRLPIGLENIIRNVSAETVRNFYRKWYHPKHMAFVAVGDFEDTESVVELIKLHFQEKDPVVEKRAYNELPLYHVPSHEEPRFSCFAETEAGGSAVVVSWKIPSRQIVTVADYRYTVAEGMFHSALNQRFFKLSRQQEPPFFSCASVDDNLVRPVKAYTITASCKEKGTLEAVESILTEVARIRLHGFSERELAMVRAFLTADMESAYLERDQMQSTSYREEYMEHFLHNEPVVGIEYEARLQKAVLPGITATEVADIANLLKARLSCIIKTIEPRVSVTVKDLKNVIAKVQALEDEGSIPPWNEEDVPEEVVENKPEPGVILETTVYEEFGATELVLSNGLRVCYKPTDFLDDQIVFSGFAYGGLSQVPEKDFLTCSMGSTIAGEIGVFGHKPSVLMDILAGKRAEVGTKIGAYMRSFSGDCSPTDLEIALQLIYQLFVTSVHPGNDEVKLVMQMTKEGIEAQERDPFTAYVNRVREINYGNSYYFKPITVKDLRKVDPLRACAFFDSCFKDPSAFTIAIVGKIIPEKVVPLILQYLGGIPSPSEPVMKYNRDDLQGLPFTFPAGIIREEVRRSMVEAQGSVQITFPVELKASNMMEEVHFTSFISKLLETKMMQVLRFKHGQIYTASVSAFLGGSKPSRSSDVCGDIAISFSCDPDSAWKLVEFSLEEVARLQLEGPTKQEVLTVLEIEQRAHENGQQENIYWLDRLSRAYQSRLYVGDLNTSFQAQDQWRDSVRSSLDEVAMQKALCRILPVPCAQRHTAVALVPRPSRMKAIAGLLNTTTVSRKLVIAAAGAGMCVFMLWRLRQRRVSS
ncbi:zinc protease PQQL-like [Selaginella moellendorffii]|uniref:zinc protease PQQL-like n=1 Tax=Selaginella moellendorffii TaxID=88036 RepID=UPI000D1CC280|nr:zinc protease PQQL-like [Selaginella moellendorffii]|eukprot:XP_024516679.1 zinc protease PQQL-like [Selaginella moellendorffii]